jgi:hypothetical protein
MLHYCMDTDVYTWPSTLQTRLFPLTLQVFAVAHPRTTMHLSFGVSVARIFVQWAFYTKAYIALLRDEIDRRVQAVMLTLIALEA